MRNVTNAAIGGGGGRSPLWPIFFPESAGL
jgi:hypothetical protein